MLISVVLNCFNGEKFLKRSIESVLNQTYDIFEIIFIDNGSTDQSAEIAKSFGPKIIYHKNDKTSTLGSARNQGIMLSKGQFIAFIDADDEWKLDKIEKQIKLFSNDISFIFSNTKMSQEDESFFKLFDFAKVDRRNLFNSLLENDFISTSSVIFKKDLYTSLKEKYNKNLTIECDRDLFIRIAGICELNYTKDCLVTRYLHNTSTSAIHNAASINEFIILEKSINNFCLSHGNDYSASLEIFNSRINILKGRHYWQLGDLKNARVSFSNSLSIKGNLLNFLTFCYPFKSRLSLLIFLMRNYKYLSSFFKK